ncbi:MAG: YncE family protein [Brevinematia bacterium]
MLKKLTISLTLLVVIFSCSEVPQSSSSAEGVPKNSLLVIDEANMYLKSYNISSGEVKSLMEIGNAANDIEVDGDYAYVAVSLDNKLLRINLLSLSKDFIDFAGANPYNLCLDSDRIYLTLSVSNKLAVVSKSTFSVITNISLVSPGYPMGVRVDANYVYVATSDGYPSYGNSRIEIYSKANYSLITNIATIHKNPQSLWVKNGLVYIAATGTYSSNGGVERLAVSNFNIESFATIPSPNPTYIYGFDNYICVIESSWGGSGGVYVYNESTALLTNLLGGISLKGMEAKDGFLYVSEAYAGTKTYKINMSDYSVSQIPVGGGDIAIYK